MNWIGIALVAGALGVTAFVLAAHFYFPNWPRFHVGANSMTLSLFLVLVFLVISEPLPFIILATISVAYSAVLFVFLSQAMMEGMGRRLTRWRGEKWIKELDYLYILLAGVSVVFAMNHLNSVTAKFSIPDSLGVLVLCTALVIRLVKTRAEINGWQKPDYKPPFVPTPI